MSKSRHIKSTLRYTVCAATKEVTFISENLRAKLTAKIKDLTVYACVLESDYFVYLIKHDGHSRPLRVTRLRLVIWKTFWLRDVLSWVVKP